MISGHNGAAHWRIDKHIPVAVIISILLQTAAIIWFTAKIDSRVQNLEEKATQNDMRTNALLIELGDMGKRLVRLETLLEMQIKATERQTK